MTPEASSMMGESGGHLEAPADGNCPRSAISRPPLMVIRAGSHA